MDSDENMSNPPEDGDGDIESEIEAASTVEALQQEEEQQFIVSQKDQHEIDTEENIKLAPSYFVIRACADKDEDWPGPRCGHTLTAVAAIGEEGSPSYVGPRLVLFGGATALEGNTPPPSPAGIAGIRLAEVTADVHCFDILSKKWTRLHPAGPAPSPRAAHAATAVGPMVVIQGGIGPAGFSTEDLHVLDLSSSQPRWHRVVVQGSGPGPRYGHVLCLFEQRFLLSICGNDGKSLLADVWALDTAAKPYEWRKLEPGGDGPRPCMYAAASTRLDGLLVICGGRDSNNVPLSSAHALGRKDDGSWEWATATGISPAPRYQHAAAFVNSRLHVSGGAYGRGHIVDDASSVVVLDTVAQLWCDKKSVLSKPGRYKSDQLGGVEMMRRCRHAAAAVGDHIYIYGGLKAGALLSDLLMADDRLAPEAPTSGIREARAALTSSSSRMMGDGMPMDGYVDGATLHHSDGSVEEQPSADTYDNSSTVANMNHVPGHWNRRDTNVDVLVEASAAEAEAISSTMAKVNAEYQLSRSSSEKESGNLSGLTNNASRRGLVTSDVRLHHRAVVVSEAAGGVLGGLVRQLSIDQFENEGRRVEIAGAAKKLLDRQMSTHGTHKKVLSSLLRPRGWRPPVRRQFFLDFSEVRELCDTVEKLFMKEPNVLRLKAPIKIFGDLHGQFGDLMRLFDEYGSPSTAGDISYIDYLFLGDYVDRGQHSLETILLLLALKIEHPYHVHLIRGNHEAADINALFGFRTECIERMGEREGIWAWQRVNQLFNWLPLSALIEDRIICMHGGIGRSINYVGQIDSLQRPITMDTGSVVLMDLLWSDPTENDSVEGLRPNARGPGLVTFGPDRVMEFCKNNDLQLIIRAHECVMDGFERFAQGHLITLFSATNYCGTANNAGAILVLGRDMVVVPKLIHPIPPALHSGELSLDQYSDEAWMQELNVQRPPTPTRGRPQPSNGRTSLAFI